MVVTVPHGVSSGQTIRVDGPDGRTVEAVVPPGMQPGSVFMVEMPPRPVSPAPSSYGNVHPLPPPTSASVVAEPAFAHAVQLQSAPESSMSGVNAPVATAAPVTATPVTPVPNHYGTAASSVTPLPPPSQQQFVRVQVPPGTSPGSTIHVQIQGENRTVAAQVPSGGVSEFHVAYEPQAAAAASDTAKMYHSPGGHMPPPLAPPPVAPHHQNNNERMLLVRVPPGTPSGTLLHVNVPDEPGRMITATVPPGNVTEFHVKYTPSSSSSERASATPMHHPPQQQQQQYHQQQQPYRDDGFASSFGFNGMHSNNNNNNSCYGNGNGYNGGYGGQQQYQQQQYGSYNNNNRNNNGGGGFGNMFLPLLGGAALGAAGMAIFDGDFGGGGDDGGYDE